MFLACMVSWKVLKAFCFFLPTYKWLVPSTKDSLMLHWLQMRMPYALHVISGLWLSSLSYLLIKVVFSSHHSHDTIMSVKISLSQSLLIGAKSVWYPKTCIWCSSWCFNFFNNFFFLLSIVLLALIMLIDVSIDHGEASKLEVL